MDVNRHPFASTFFSFIPSELALLLHHRNPTDKVSKVLFDILE